MPGRYVIKSYGKSTLTLWLLMALFILYAPGYIAASAASVNRVNNDLWNELLAAHVLSNDGGKSTHVDYAGMQRDQDKLQQYLGQLSAVTQPEFERFTREQQLAFLINAYNAFTIELILTEWPDIDSIRDIGGFWRSPWKREFISLLGESVSLDQIEHEWIRGSGRYQEPRIHFAVNCASIGCPALRSEAYTGERLDEQLEDQTYLFLSDQSRNRLKNNQTLLLSEIFDWYREDFEGGNMGYQRLEDFLLNYRDALNMNAAAVQQLSLGEMDIDFLDYDWRLNDKSR